MLAALVFLTFLFVIATTGASYFGFMDDDDVTNPFLSEGPWATDVHNRVVHEHKDGNEFLAEDANGGGSKSFLKSDLNKPKNRLKQLKDGRVYNDVKDWNSKAKDGKNKNKNRKIKNKNSKNSRHNNHVISPQNDDPTQNSRKLKGSKNYDERLEFIKTMNKNAQQTSNQFHGHPLRSNLPLNQDFYYPPPPQRIYHQPYNLPQFHGRQNYQTLPTSYQKALLPYLLYPQPSDQQGGNKFSAEGEKISMALVKAITDYLKATGDAKGLTKVVQALTAFNEIFTSPTYYGPLMDGYKKFLEKISAHSFLQSLNDDQMNLPRVAIENKNMDFQKLAQQQQQQQLKYNSLMKKSQDGNEMNEKLTKAIGDYLSTKQSTTTTTPPGKIEQKSKLKKENTTSEEFV